MPLLGVLILVLLFQHVLRSLSMSMSSGNNELIESDLSETEPSFLSQHNEAKWWDVWKGVFISFQRHLHISSFLAGTFRSFTAAQNFFTTRQSVRQMHHDANVAGDKKELVQAHPGEITSMSKYNLIKRPKDRRWAIRRRFLLQFAYIILILFAIFCILSYIYATFYGIPRPALEQLSSKHSFNLQVEVPGENIGEIERYCIIYTPQWFIQWSIPSYLRTACAPKRNFVKVF